MRFKQLLFIIAALSLFGCSGNKDEGNSAVEVVDKYVDTLQSAPQKAEDAAKAEEKRSETEEKAIKELDQ